MDYWKPDWAMNTQANVNFIVGARASGKTCGLMNALVRPYYGRYCKALIIRLPDSTGSVFETVEGVTREKDGRYWFKQDGCRKRLAGMEITLRDVADNCNEFSKDEMKDYDFFEYRSVVFDDAFITAGIDAQKADFVIRKVLSYTPGARVYFTAVSFSNIKRIITNRHLESVVNSIIPGDRMTLIRDRLLYSFDYTMG